MRNTIARYIPICTTNWQLDLWNVFFFATIGFQIASGIVTLLSALLLLLLGMRSGLP